MSGTILHDRFLKLSAKYEVKQQEVAEKTKTDRGVVIAWEQGKADLASFVAVIPTYVGITKLMPTIINEFVKKIHAPGISRDHYRQKIQMIWNFIGELKQNEDKQTI